MTTASIAAHRPLPDASAACDASQFVGTPLRRGQRGAVRWHDDGHWVWGEVEVDGGSDLTEPTRLAYTDLFAALADAGAPHLLRLWNRVPRINAATAGLERYRQFNIGRQQAFIECGRDAFEGAPAACAVGTPGGPLGIRFLAGREPPMPIENPRQVSAYRYSAAWGPRAPTFSRAALAEAGDSRLALFVSGTASIVGERSMHDGDVIAQCAETLRNLDAVIAQARGRSTADWRPEAFEWVVYLRRAESWDQVREPIAAWCGHAPVAPLEADICRAELLIEIEGHAFASRLALAMSWRLGVRAGCLMLAAATPPAFADRPLWELGAGAGALRLPNYRGSSEARAWLFPVPYFVYRGEILRADRQGTRAVLLDAERFDFDVSFAASAPASSDGDPAREGMPDLRPSVEIGPQLNLRVAQGAGWKVDLRAPLRSVVLVQRNPRSIGWSASPVLNLDLDVEGGNLGLQTGVLWGSRKLHEYYYGVAPAFATATRPAYAAGSGYAGWQATIAYSRRIGSWWIGGFARRDQLAGTVFEPSPLVRERQPWAAGFVVSYVFAQSDERVPERR